MANPSFILTIFLIIIILLLIFLIIRTFKTSQNADSQKAQDDSSLRLLLDHVNNISNTVDQRIARTHDSMSQTISSQTQQSLNAIRDVTKHLTQLDATNQKVAGFAEELKSLQNILKNPKQRGILGEYYLETALKNVLSPKDYTMQYLFDDGLIVDAAITVGELLIPIDAKFSLENYNRIVKADSDTERQQYEKIFKGDIKKRIDETSKYIRSHYGTTDFAFMYIPHEAIYYDLLVNEIGAMKVNTQDLIEYALNKKVIIVSPTSFYAFLQTVLHGLRMLHIEKSAQDIQKHVRDLSRHVTAYQEFHNKLGKTLGTTVNHFNAATKEFTKVGKDIRRITDEDIELEIERIDGGIENKD